MTDRDRLSALRQSNLLDSLPEAEFDRLTALARRVLGVPVALVSLVDRDRQFFKSQQGLPEPWATARETPLSHSFCQHVVASDAPFVVENAREHPLVRDNCAIRDLSVVAYLGVPVHSPGGHALGALCAIDGEPRTWTDDDVAALLDLAAMAETEIALRAEVAARAHSEDQYRALFESSLDAVLVLDPETETVLKANDAACALYGRTRDELDWAALETEATGPLRGKTVVELLVAKGGTSRFESVQRRADGTPVEVDIGASLVRVGDAQVVLAVNRDVTERNRAEAALRDSEGRYQTFLALSAEGIWRFDVDEPIPVDLPTAEQVARIFALGYLAECNAAMARMYGFEEPGDLAGTRLSDFLDPADPQNVAYLTAFVDCGYRLDDVESHESGRDGQPLVFENSLIGLVAPGPDGRPALVRAWGTQRDVSGRHAAEAALRASEERYRLLADTATDVILTIDTAGTIRYANRAVEVVFGYAPDEIVGAPLSVLMPADQRPVHHASMGAYVRSGDRGTPWGQVETRGLRKDGTEAQIAISFGEYTVGKERLFTGIIRDTTAQKATEQALVQSEARFRQIAEVLPQLVWTARPDGVHDFFNSRWYAYTGMTPGDTDWQWKDYAHPDDWARSVAQLQRSLDTGEPYEIEYRIRRASDGAYRWFIGRAEPLRDEAGAIVGWFGTSTDIHDLREAQERLRAKGEQLRLVHRATTDVVWDWDATSGVLAWGPAVADVMGWEDAIVGTDLAWWGDKIHPEDRGRAVASFEASLASEDATRQEEYRFRRADGSYAFVLDRWYVVRDAEGTVVRVVGAMVDLSERKAVEIELVAAREAAETAARLKSSLLANMSHEIRTPLTAILGYADMLAEEAPPDLQDLVEPIGRGGRRLMNTLNSVLDLAQIEAGEVSLASDSVGLLAEVDEACAVLQPLALAKGIDLRVGGVPVCALADRPALGRVLTNIVGNAVKFTDSGSVTVEAGGGSEWAWIRVSDTGVGIAAEFLPTLFSEFKQESEGHGRAYEGNGLGLAITKRLVGLMGGQISVESEKGVGSVFTVCLPLATPVASAELEQDVSTSPLLC